MLQRPYALSSGTLRWVGEAEWQVGLQPRWSSPAAVVLTTALHCPAHLAAEPALPCAEVAFLLTSTLCQPLNTYF